METQRKIHCLEFVFLASMLILLNFGLWRGMPNTRLIFLPDLVAAGEWWRLLTHPLIHVSPYHLLLDGLAFLLLYANLKASRFMQRAGYVAACGAGALVLSGLSSSVVPVAGLCGLSGIAHGLMAITGLEMMRERSNYRIGGVVLAIVLLKSFWEMVSGNVLFSSQHLGAVGLPVVESHAGGVIGGIVGYGLLNTHRFRNRSRNGGDLFPRPATNRRCFYQSDFDRGRPS